ncbi:hypothetical protein MPH_01927 [Macrophomina phaseolina MS6]|uniref:Uncharacterized protein n=1 Tax=Macrophomina phaseolina (strain MS6) TaxID=1126212 RepID=K2SVY3_MACPH|nr:hypothetical protein MPH_01927 [Macrophomina phaseolina MS6]
MLFINNLPVLLLLSLITTVLAQLPSLNIRQDEAAKSQGHYIWTSKVVYDGPTSELFTGNQLYGLARQAWKEMAEQWESPVRVVRGNRPGMMGALAVGNSVYFSSSARGDNFFYRYPRPDTQPLEVQRALDLCQGSLALERDELDRPHFTSASCAEIMALHQFFQDPDVPRADKTTLPSMRVVAYGAGRSKVAKPFPPCGTTGNPDTWGCKQFTDFMKIEVPPAPLEEEVEDKNPPAVPVSTTQISVCVNG